MLAGIPTALPLVITGSGMSAGKGLVSPGSITGIQKPGIMELPAEEFLQRFSLHILPHGFMKIRHYGILGSRKKSPALSLARKSLNADPPVSRKGLCWQELFMILFGREPFTCPICKKGKMVVIQSVHPSSRGSPQVKILPNYAFSLQ